MLRTMRLAIAIAAAIATAVATSAAPIQTNAPTRPTRFSSSTVTTGTPPSATQPPRLIPLDFNITDANGQPITSATISRATHYGYPQGQPQQVLGSSDSQGHAIIGFQADHMMGDFTITAEGFFPEKFNPSGIYSQDWLRAQRDLTTFTATITLKQASQLRGITADDSGAPLPNVQINVLPAQVTGYDPPTIAQISSDGDGAFSHSPVPNEKLLLEATAPGFATTWLEANPGEQAIINMQRGVTVSGRASWLDTAKPAAGTRITLGITNKSNSSDYRALHTTPRQWSADCIIGESSSFSFRNVPIGSYILAIPTQPNFGQDATPKQPHASIWNPPTFYVPVTVAEGQAPAPLEVQLFKGYEIRGTLSESGTSNTIPGARVWLYGISHNTTSTLTDANGWYQFTGIKPGGNLQITAQARGYQMLADNRYTSLNTTITIPLALPTSSPLLQYDFSMAKERHARGQVVDSATSQPISGVKVTVVKDFYHDYMQNNTRNSITDGTGRFDIPTQPGEVFRLRAEAAGYALHISDPIRLLDDTETILRLTPGGNLSGIVLDDQGRPAEAAKVNLSLTISGGYDQLRGNETYRENLKTEGATGADGQFLIENLPTGGSLTVSARKDGFAPSDVASIVVSPGKSTSVTLQLRKATHLAGRVFDPAGAPLKGVTVAATPIGTSGAGSARTNDAGQYRVENLPEGMADVSISHPRLGNEWFYDVQLGRDDADFRFGKGDKNGAQRLARREKERRVESGITLYGTVVDYQTGEPVKSFRVFATPGLRVEQDPELEGEFMVKGLKPLTLYQFIKITSPGYATYDSGVLYVHAGETEMRKVFKLGPGGTITGRAVDTSTKQPIAGITVSLTSQEPGGITAAEAQEKIEPVTTDADGKFTLVKVGQGRKLLDYQPPADGTYVKMTQPVDVIYNEVTDLGDVEFGTGGTIKGKLVRFPGELPIPNARITLEGNKHPAVITDGDGAFEFTGLINGLYHVNAAEYGANTWVGVEQLETKEVMLEVGTGKLTGTVLRGGKPYPCSVKLQKIGYGQSVARWAKADNSGQFVVTELPPGRWDVILTSNQDASYTTSRFISMPDNGDSVEETFNFPSGGLRITVTDSTGAPAVNAQVLARQVNGPSAPLQGQGLTRTTDAQGRATIEDLTPGSYTVTASTDAGERGEKAGVTVTNDGATPVAITLSPGIGGSLVSTALNMANGKPVPTAWCYLFREDGSMFDHGKQRDELGIVRIENIPPGKYKVQVSALGYSVSTQDVTIEAGQISQIDDVLYPSGALRWALKSSAGAPAAGIPCTLTPSDASSIEEPRTGTTNSDGVFVVRGLLPGAYVATAQWNGKTISKPVMIYAANVTDEVSWLQ